MFGCSGHSHVSFGNIDCDAVERVDRVFAPPVREDHVLDLSRDSGLFWRTDVARGLVERLELYGRFFVGEDVFPVIERRGTSVGIGGEELKKKKK